MTQSRSKTVFTPTEATQTLPLVRKIVADLLVKGRRLREIEKLEAMLVTQEIEDELSLLNQDMEGHHQELTQIGCSYRDWNFELGLVDFPSVIEGQDVLLCWKSDEPSLIHYHGLTDGFRGRKPIPPSLLGE